MVLAGLPLALGCTAAQQPAGPSQQNPAQHNSDFGLPVQQTTTQQAATPQARTTTAPPPACTPAFNAKLASLIASQTRSDVDNVGVCGVSVRHSTTQRGGSHGSHQIIAVRATLPSGQQSLIEVVTNDDLDGVVTANPNDAVIAFGQGYVLAHGQYAGGVHDVHCSTHAGAENGYVNVAGRQYPASCPPVGEFRHRHARGYDAPSF